MHRETIKLLNTSPEPIPQKTRKKCPKHGKIYIREKKRQICMTGKRIARKKRLKTRKNSPSN